MNKFRPALKAASLKNYTTIFSLLLVTAVGGFLRFYNLNWDIGLSFHPDERNIAAAVSRLHFFNQLNPQFFAYGGFLLYVYRATGEFLYYFTGDPSWILSWEKINIIGRFFSAVFSTLTIPTIYILTKRLFNKIDVALFASSIAAFTVSFIQIAHYGVTESLLAYLAVLLCLLSVYLIEKPRFKSYTLCGIIYGVAIATKISGLPLILFPFTAYLIVVLKKPYSFRSFFRNSLLFLAFLVVGSLVFVIFSSYIFSSWDKFLESMRYESGVATGRFTVPYTLQFTDTTPYLFQIKNLFWQLGPIAFFSIIGFALLPSILTHKNAGKLGLFLLFPTVYFAYLGSWHTKFIRFMIPILPFLIIAASFMLVSLRSKWKVLGNMWVTLFFALTVLWAFAFFSIYTREQTRIVASKWIYQHIPAGSKIFGEHWDDSLPVSFPDFNLSRSRYYIEELTIYEPDNEAKRLYYAKKLSQADYIVISSRRLYGTLIHLEEKYPLTSRYYKLLFAGKLGYEKVAEFTSYPSLFGIEIKDDDSEESFQVYDHPKVMIFAKTTAMTLERLAEVLRGNRFPTIQ